MIAHTKQPVNYSKDNFKKNLAQHRADYNRYSGPDSTFNLAYSSNMLAFSKWIKKQKDLSLTQLAVLNQIISSFGFDSHKEKNYLFCWYSQQRIANELTVTKKTIERAISVFKDKGILVIQHRTKKTINDKIVKTSNYYSINTELYLAWVKDKPVKDKPVKDKPVKKPVKPVKPVKRMPNSIEAWAQVTNRYKYDRIAFSRTTEVNERIKSVIADTDELSDIEQVLKAGEYSAIRELQTQFKHAWNRQLFQEAGPLFS